MIDNAFRLTIDKDSVSPYVIRKNDLEAYLENYKIVMTKEWSIVNKNLKISDVSRLCNQVFKNII